MDQDRTLCYQILKDVEEGAFSNLAVAKALARASVYSPAFVRELVYGVLRNALLLDSNIARFLRAPGLKRPERILLRMGFYQLACMDAVADHAAVNETVALAWRFAKGREGFVNAVLRAFLREGKTLQMPGEGSVADRLSIRYSASADLVRFWIDAYGLKQTAAILENACRVPALALRVNRLKTDAQALASLLAREGVETQPALQHPGALLAKGPALSTEAYAEGLFSVQGECSQMAVSRLAPRPGETVLDLCAAPGGKSCAAAELMEDRGRVIACDLHENRTALIEKEAARLGLAIVRAETADASARRPEWLGMADRVIADVPCSGLGTIAKKPEIKLRGLAGVDPKLPALQLAILENAAGCLKEEGTLLYSTCTLNPAENGDVVRAFLAKTPGFALASEETVFPSPLQSDGFYIALIRRTNDQRRL